MFTIGRLAALTELTTDALRYYEREKLFAPAAKSAGGYRLYEQESVRRIRFIKQAQQCGFTLADIRELLNLRNRDSACCNDVRRLAVEKRLQLEGTIKAMKSMSKALERLIAYCADDAKPVGDCPILAALDEVGGVTCAPPSRGKSGNSLYGSLSRMRGGKTRHSVRARDGERRPQMTRRKRAKGKV
jgi:MerR family Zn(II)-responsive transcriptional regulator of zntA